MNAQARATPSAVANEACPGGGRGKDLPDALGVEAQGAQRHVPELGSKDHFFNDADLGSGESAGHGPRTRGAIVEAANHGDAPPGMVAGGLQSEYSQDECEGQGRLGAGDRPQDARLGVSLWEPFARETEAGGSKECDQETDGCGKDSRSPVQSLDGAEELQAVMAQGIETDDRAEAATLPVGDGRTRDAYRVAQ